MSSLCRDISNTASVEHDVIIVGGGIYGAMLMLEASKAGLKPLLLERSDFGGNTSSNNLRIVHGGLRYLQSMHLTRFRESVKERQWFLRTFPDLVSPIACVMPLYGQLVKNNLTLKAALMVNDVLSRKRNEGVASTHHLQNGRILNANETRKLFPLVRTAGLKGGALWFDAVMPDCNRILMETIRWCVSAQGTALNYVSANELDRTGDETLGVSATDEISKENIKFRSNVVINAAGPECFDTACQFDPTTRRFYLPSLAWNVVLDREPLSEGAVAVQAPTPGSQVYFAHSLNGKLFLGTGHHAMSCKDDLMVASQHVEKMLSDLNSAIPGINLRESDVLHVFMGQLPVKKENGIELADEPTIIDHGSQGGPFGLYSVSGVKFTTARSTAESLVARILSNHEFLLRGVADFPERPAPNRYALDVDFASNDERNEIIDNLITTESPRFLEDLFFRRSNLVLDPDRAKTLAESLKIPLSWKSAAQ